MRLQKIGIAVASAAALGAGVVGGTALAAGGNNAGGNGGPGGFGHGPGGYGGPGPGFGGYGAPGTPGQAGHQHTQVTGSELAKVKAAVAEKDSAITVKQVLQDPDGSYDVFGTKSGKPVMLEVSKDLATITERTGGPGGPGRRGPGGPPGTAVTGSELTKVKAAVADKDSAVSVKSVRQLPDGSYAVLGTKNSKPVMFHVSKDLGTVTEQTGRPGGPGGQAGHHGFGGPGGPGGYGGPPPAGAPSGNPT